MFLTSILYAATTCTLPPTDISTTSTMDPAFSSNGSLFPDTVCKSDSMPSMPFSYCAMMKSEVSVE